MNDRIKPNIYLTETEKETTSQSSSVLPPIKTSVLNTEFSIKAPLLSRIQKKYTIEKSPRKKEENEAKKKPTMYKQLNVRYSNHDFLEKTREITRLKYSLQLKLDSKNQYEENIKNEIAGIEETMKSMENYRDNFDRNVTQKFNEYLKKLYSEIEKEKNKVWGLYKTLSEHRKENNILESKIRKKENEKNTLEKWIIFQLVVKNGKEPTDLQKELEKFKGGFIFETADEFLDGFTKEEDKNILLLEQYEKVNKSIEELIKERDTLIETREKEEKKLKQQIDEKQVILNLLKKRNEKLMKQKEEAMILSRNKIKQRKKEIQSSLNFNLFNSVNFELLHSDTKGKDLLYSMIYSLYSEIVANLSTELDNITVNFKALPTKEKKMISMLISVEISANYIFNKMIYYKKNSDIYGERLAAIIKQIDVMHKREKANVLKQLEQKKYKELKDKIAKRNDKVYFIPNKKNLVYPFQLYQGKKKRGSSHDKDKELGLEDFLYESS